MIYDIYVAFLRMRVNSVYIHDICKSRIRVWCMHIIYTYMISVWYMNLTYKYMIYKEKDMSRLILTSYISFIIHNVHRAYNLDMIHVMYLYITHIILDIVHITYIIHTMYHLDIIHIYTYIYVSYMWCIFISYKIHYVHDIKKIYHMSYHTYTIYNVYTIYTRYIDDIYFIIHLVGRKGGYWVQWWYQASLQSLSADF